MVAKLGIMLALVLPLLVAVAPTVQPPPVTVPSPPPVAATPAPPSPLPTAAPTLVPDPAVDARALDWFHRLQDGRIDFSQLDGQAKQALNSDVILMTQTQWSVLGWPVSFDEVRQDPPTIAAPEWKYLYRMTFSDDSVLDFFFSVDAQGLISGMRLAPEQ